MLLMAPPRAVAVVAALLVAVGPACSRGEAPSADQTSAAPPATNTTSATASPTPVSDEDLVRETVLTFQNAYNTQNWDAYFAAMCPAWRDQYTQPMIEAMKKTRADQGLTTVTVAGVQVNGDTATATLDARNELLGQKMIELILVREDGWKVCMHTG